MNELKWCEKCDSYNFGKCKCVAWLVYDVEDYASAEEAHKDARAVHAEDAEDAAEQWAKLGDCDCDFSIVEGDGVTVCVLPYDLPGSTPEYFEITGEFEVVYSTTEVEPPGQPDRAPPEECS